MSSRVTCISTLAAAHPQERRILDTNMQVHSDGSFTRSTSACMFNRMDLSFGCCFTTIRVPREGTHDDSLGRFQHVRPTRVCTTYKSYGAPLGHATARHMARHSVSRVSLNLLNSVNRVFINSPDSIGHAAPYSNMSSSPKTPVSDVQLYDYCCDIPKHAANQTAKWFSRSIFC